MSEKNSLDYLNLNFKLARVIMFMYLHMTTKEICQMKIDKDA